VKGETVKKLLKIGVFLAIFIGIAKLIESQKAEWQGLTETEIRAKLHDKLDSKIPPEKVDELGDGIVKMMREKGKLGEEIADLGDDIAELGEETPAED
jgi:hypothetical protein